MHFVFPENSDRFPYSCPLSRRLYYSPKALAYVRQLVAGKPAFLVPLRGGRDEFLLGDALGLPVMSPDADTLARVAGKSFAKDLFA